MLLGLEIQQRFTNAYNNEALDVMESQHRTLKEHLINLKLHYKNKNMERILIKLCQHMFNNTIKKSVGFREGYLVKRLEKVTP